MKPSIRYSTNATALPPTDSVFPGLRIPSNPMDQPPLCLAQCHPSTRTLPRRDKGQVHTVRPVVNTKNGPRWDGSGFHLVIKSRALWIVIENDFGSGHPRALISFCIRVFPVYAMIRGDLRAVVGGEEICYVDFFFLG